MKKLFTSHLLVAVVALLAISCNKEEVHAQITSQNNMEINITIEGQTMSVYLVDNVATRRLVELLQEGLITYVADDYGGFEKVGALGRSLPTSNSELRTEAGDVVLYNGNQIVLFYGSNSWSYTRLGRIDYSSLDELKAFLKAGQGRVSVTLSVAEPLDVKPIAASVQQPEEVYSMNGLPIPTSHNKSVNIQKMSDGSVKKILAK